MSNTEKTFIGKTFILYNFDNSEMVRFKINHVKEEYTEEYKCDDGYIIPSQKEIAVSENGSGYYTYREGSLFNKIM